MDPLLELGAEVSLRGLIVASTCVVGEPLSRVHLLDLFLEEVLLVKEEDYIRASKIVRICNLLKEIERLDEAVFGCVLSHHLIVLG